MFPVLLKEEANLPESGKGRAREKASEMFGVDSRYIIPYPQPCTLLFYHIIK